MKHGNSATVTCFSGPRFLFFESFFSYYFCASIWVFCSCVYLHPTSKSSVSSGPNVSIRNAQNASFTKNEGLRIWPL